MKHSIIAPVLGAVALAFALAVPRPVLAQGDSVRVEGRVADANGAVIPNAKVVLRAAGGELTRRTDPDGTFEFEAVPASTGTLRVDASGFESFEISWNSSDQRRVLDIVLEATAISEEIVVTASRGERRIADTPSSVVVVSKRDLDTTAAATLDDSLRQVPGFSLFRRTGSRVANPTTQGASLRGVAPSGASRITVLADGMPMNDPFGGWVYWGRIPREEISRIEVLRGAASSLYGTDALGGVVNIITARPQARRSFSLEAAYGTEQTSQLSVAGSAELGGWRGTVSLEAFDTEGYVLVAADQRGLVDTPAGGGRTAISARIERDIGSVARVFVRGSLFGESRENGTPLQTNRTHIREVVAGGDVEAGAFGSLTARAFTSAQVYDQTFTAVAEDRASESLTRLQRVPAQQAGFSAQWARAFGEDVEVVAGVDAREVRGASDEVGFFAGRATSALGAGGRRRDVGVFGDVTFRPVAAVQIGAGARLDRWRNFDARSTSSSPSGSGPTTVASFEDRTESVLSPRGSLLVRVARSVALVGSGYRAFRTPTLNELYRGFRVGDVVTLANRNLVAERLTGGEGGVDLTLADGTIDARAVFYWSEIIRPVANVTLEVTPELITRQRQNLGRTRARGVEIDLRARATRSLSITAGYAYSDSRVERFEANRSLEGLRIPQVPAHVATIQLQYSGGERVTLGVQGRLASSQFDDDQNRLRLGGFGTVDALAAYRLGTHAELFVSAENVFDRRYDVGRTPVLTIGPPASARFGVRLKRR
jgi:outer membrane receptor protein involved in Fe transport